MNKYGVFIIESLRSGDFLDGKNLSKILKLSYIANKYREVHSKIGFSQAIIEYGGISLTGVTTRYSFSRHGGLSKNIERT